MGDLNKCCLLGRLGADPEIRTTQSGEKVATFRIATSEQWKKDGEKKERTEWHTVVAWGPLAGLAERFLRKGGRVYVEGPQRTRKWQDQSGNDRYLTEIVLSGFGARLDVIDWPDGSGNGAARGQEDAYGSDQLPPSGRSDLDDDIPF